MRRTPSFRPLAIAGLALAALAAACTVVVEERPPLTPPSPGYCPRNWDPVCARSGPDRQTFANACLAEVSGYRIVHPGQCRGGGPGGPGGPGWGGPGRPPGGPGGPGGGPQFCTREYNPVCARRGNHVRTFGNSCEAGVSGYEILFRGTCE